MNNIKNMKNKIASKSFLKSKKAMTYLLVSSLLVVVLLGIFFVSNRYGYRDQTELYTLRIMSMNDFIKNFNSDVHRATYVSAFRTMIALEDYVTTNSRYLDNVNASFKETFYNGTINSTSVEIMDNSSFRDYITKVNNLAQDMGMTLNVSVENIELSQSDPWSIDVKIYLIINLTDSTRTVSWHNSEEFYTNIPIDNLRDPLYGVSTLNKIPNAIRRQNNTLVSGSDTSGLISHINQSYYLESSDAPSFLKRFEGDFTSDPNGIESIVYIPVLSDQKIDVDLDAVKIDYIYFNAINTDKVCEVENIPSDYYFVIPSNRVALYQVDLLNYSIICP
jgi:hypothetical protein